MAKKWPKWWKNGQKLPKGTKSCDNLPKVAKSRHNVLKNWWSPDKTSKAGHSDYWQNVFLTKRLTWIRPDKTSKVVRHSPDKTSKVVRPSWRNVILTKRLPDETSADHLIECSNGLLVQMLIECSENVARRFEASGRKYKWCTRRNPSLRWLQVEHCTCSKWPLCCCCML